jgi:hypothetical protein
MALFPIFVGEAASRLYLLVNRLEEDFLYYESLPAGLRSNDMGLDRGLLGQEKVVGFERYGPKLMLVQENRDYRADSRDADERRAVAGSFARSILASFPARQQNGAKYSTGRISGAFT